MENNQNPKKEESKRYVGAKLVKEVKDTGEKTSGGFEIIEVTFEDGVKEWFSSLMFPKIVTEQPLDPSALRDKRLSPVVQILLSVFRDWGVKVSELAYVSALLTQSLQYNEDEALRELWSKWMPKPQTPQDVDYITIDKVLKTIKEEKRVTLDDILGDKSK